MAFLFQSKQEAIEGHIATRVKEDVLRDFLDIYLDEMEEQERKNLPTTFSNEFSLFY